jgi:hypothetical protein
MKILQQMKMLPQMKIRHPQMKIRHPQMKILYRMKMLPQMKILPKMNPLSNLITPNRQVVKDHANLDQRKIRIRLADAVKI